MTQDPRIESLARALWEAEWPDMAKLKPGDKYYIADVHETHFSRARELLTFLDWAKENGELGHEHFDEQDHEDGIIISTTYGKQICWNTGDSDE